MEEKVGWVKIELGQLCDVVRGASPRPMGDPRYFTGDIPFIKIGDVTKISGKTIFDSEVHVNEEGAKRSRLLKKGSLILSNSGTVCIPKFLGVDACIHDGFVTFNNMPDFVLQNFLFHYFHYIRPYVIQKHKQGVTQVNLNTTIVKEFEFSLLPLPEQRAIVSKIEQLFSELDNGISNLKLAQEQLKVYRQAVLKKAFEGELTKKWREQQTDLPDAKNLLEQISKEREVAAKVIGKKQKAVKPFTKDESTELSTIPDGWKWVKTAEIIDPINNGYTPKANFLSSGLGEIPFIKVYNLNFDGSLNFQKDPTFIPKIIHQKELARSITYPGDVLINIVGPPLGKVSIVSRQFPEWNINQAIVLFRPNDWVTTKIISYYLQNPKTIQWLENTSKATAGQFNVKVSTCREIPFPLISMEEQQAIVQEIETRLSVCDKIEQDIETNLKKSEALRQSILKKAFEGKLLNEKELAEVREAEDWEPAEVLLERIKAEKAKNGKK